MNHEPETDLGDARQLLSAIADGEADAAEVAQGCRAWAADTRLHAHWHAYQLIGDVLRSDDLAHAPQHDQAFLERLRLRLDQEPAVLAPQALPQPPARAQVPNTPPRRAWRVPLAMAAGVSALATVLVLAIGPSGGGSPDIAQAPPTAGPVVAQGAAALAPLPEPVAAGGRMLRDANLDRYLRAHRDYATNVPGSLPGGAGRGIATVALER